MPPQEPEPRAGPQFLDIPPLGMGVLRPHRAPRVAPVGDNLGEGADDIGLLWRRRRPKSKPRSENASQTFVRVKPRRIPRRLVARARASRRTCHWWSAVRARFPKSAPRGHMTRSGCGPVFLGDCICIWSCYHPGKCASKSDVRSTLVADSERRALGGRRRYRTSADGSDASIGRNG